MKSFPLELDIQDERLTAVLDTSAPLQQIVSGLNFTEGPIWRDSNQSLIFSDIMGNTIYKYTESGGLEKFRVNSYMANGNTYDQAGRMLTCEHATSRLTRTGKDGRYEILATHYNGQQLNSPNDVVVKSDGTIYFTDPPGGRHPKYGIPREPELPFNGVFRLDPETGELTLLVDDFVMPNGLCFSLDEQQLFINDTRRRHIRVFDVDERGLLRNGRLWAETKGQLPGVPDGMKIDMQGNIYCCGPGGIQLFDKEANCLGAILTPEPTANFTFGDQDRQSLYITASTSVYKLRTQVKGYLPWTI
ncbi:MAG: SMP-30/gluconolactonase/LRE family protein [Chloroflexota bacterium]